jgi:aminomuconate-semialdehyde/2-hydroxymuconate-6-semialdehyde dehydrogenase
VEKVCNFIDGRYQAPRSGQWLDNVCPADGRVMGSIANSSQEDIDSAVAAAKKAKATWANAPVESRARCLFKMADLVQERLAGLATAESEDSGKLLAAAKTIDIPRAASNLRFFASAITQFSSEFHENRGQRAIHFTRREPIGIVGCISPWNLPLYLLTWKIAPALAAGNCVIAKPSELTPRTAAMLGEIANEAGLPAGVLNIVQGVGASAGQSLVEHLDVKAISFTGGTTTGRQIAATCAPVFKKVSLELGGKNPNVIFADCDYDKMMATTMRASFYNQGQLCLSGSRIFVEASIYDRFKKDLVERTRQMVVGHPNEKSSQIGALISKTHLEKVQSFIDDAKAEDATLLVGGNAATVEGYPQGFYFRPTVIEVQSNRGRLNQEEIFGPVVTIMPFETEAEAVELANDSRYGLSATVWTQDVSRAIRVSNDIDVGVLWVNSWLLRDLRTPFGGMKESGVGREGGLDALRFFTEPKNVSIQF